MNFSQKFIFLRNEIPRTVVFFCLTKNNNKPKQNKPKPKQNQNITQTKKKNKTKTNTMSALTQKLVSSFASSGAGAGVGIDVCFSFDTTGSMCGYLQQVKKSLDEIVTKLMEVPMVRISIISHGDYCDRNKLFRCQDFIDSSHLDSLKAFIKACPSTGGGDAPEAYEYILQQSNNLSWKKDNAKALIVIGDATPHPPSYTDQDIYWRDEVQKLVKAGVKIYGVQCGNGASTKHFYEELADLSGGVYLQHVEMNSVVDMFVGVCMREAGMLNQFRAEVSVREGHKVPSGLTNMLDNLEQSNRGIRSAPPTKSLSDIWWTREQDNGSMRYRLSIQSAHTFEVSSSPILRKPAKAPRAVKSLRARNLKKSVATKRKSTAKVHRKASVASQRTVKGARKVMAVRNQTETTRPYSKKTYSNLVNAVKGSSPASFSISRQGTPLPSKGIRRCNTMECTMLEALRFLNN